MSMNKKILACAVIVLFIVMGTIPAAGSIVKQKNVGLLCDPPIIVDCFWELGLADDGHWILVVEMSCYDETSGMDRVEFSLDDELMYTDDEPPSPYKWVLVDPFDIPDFKEKTLYVTAFDKAGNSDFVEFDCSDMSTRCIFQPRLPQFCNPLIFQIFQILLKLN